jgi:hypothetical protein
MLYSKLDRWHTWRLRKREYLLTGDGGVGGRGLAWSRIIRPQESLVLYKSFNPHWEVRRGLGSGSPVILRWDKDDGSDSTSCTCLFLLSRSYVNKNNPKSPLHGSLQKKFLYSSYKNNKNLVSSEFRWEHYYNYTCCSYGAGRHDFDAGKSISRSLGRDGP